MSDQKVNQDGEEIERKFAQPGQLPLWILRQGLFSLIDQGFIGTAPLQEELPLQFSRGTSSNSFDIFAPGRDRQRMRWSPRHENPLPDWAGELLAEVSTTGLLPKSKGIFRVRMQDGTNYSICLKRNIKTDDPTIRKEWEEPVPVNVADMLWRFTTGARVKKARYSLQRRFNSEVGTVQFDGDMFLDYPETEQKLRLSGANICEVEFPNEGSMQAFQQFALPGFLPENDVSLLKGYTNIDFALNGLPEDFFKRFNIER